MPNALAGFGLPLNTLASASLLSCVPVCYLPPPRGPQAEHGDAAGTAGVSLALQALAARGPLLLVLDGVDCLWDLNDGFSSEAEAPTEAEDGEGEPRDGEGGGGGAAAGGSGGGASLDAEPEAALSEVGMAGDWRGSKCPGTGCC
jgi:hypothetical protein